jgi:hypothetical protein
MIKHYDFGSSTAARTDACPGWKHLSAGIPRQESSYAVDGTIIHSLLEARALGVESSLVAWPNLAPVTDDHIEVATEMWDAAQEVLARFECKEWEPEVTAVTNDDVGGTLDLVATDGELCVLLDYKTGRGVQVDAVGNKQILFAAAQMMYGDSTAADMLQGVSDFVGVIIQPDKGGNIQTKTWEFTADVVDAWWEHHEQKIAEARAGSGDLSAGDHCRFCPASAICPARNGQALAALHMDPDDLGTLSEAMGLVENLKQWVRDVEAKVYEQLEAGAPVPGWKLVRGRSTEKWAEDEAVVLSKLRRKVGGKTQMYATNLITPAEARRRVAARLEDREQLDKKEAKTSADTAVSALTERTSTTKTIAPESDKRDAVIPVEAVIQSALAVG